MRPVRVLSYVRSCLDKLIKICVKIITKLIYVRFGIISLKQIMFSKYETNLKTTISQWSLKNSGLLLLLFDLIFNNFSFLIDIIENINTTFVSRDHNSHQWQCSFIVTCLRLYHVTQLCPISIHFLSVHCHFMIK